MQETPRHGYEPLKRPWADKYSTYCLFKAPQSSNYSNSLLYSILLPPLHPLGAFSPPLPATYTVFIPMGFFVSFTSFFSRFFYNTGCTYGC